MAKDIENKVVSRKQQTRLEKEQREKKWLIIATIAVLALVVLVIAYGVLQTTVLQKYQAVATVGEEKISSGEFQTRVRFERARLVQEYVFYASNPVLASYFQTQLANIQTELDDTVGFGQTILDQMIEERLIVQEAAKMGITVAEADVDKALETYFSFYPDGTPTPTITPTFMPTSTLSPEQLALIATPIPTATELPTELPTPEATATPTEVPPTPTATEEVSSTPAATPTELPTATPYTREGYEELVDNYLGDLANLNFTREDLRTYFRNRLLIQKVFEEITKDASPIQEQVWARHILVQGEPEALLLVKQLQQGADFYTLAQTASLDTASKDSGGDRGWFARGAMVKEFEEAAFSLAIGEISQPIKTDYGYHIIQVLGHEDRELSTDAFNTVKQQEFQTWLDAKKTEVGIKKFDIWTTRVPVSPSIPQELLMQ